MNEFNRPPQRKTRPKEQPTHPWLLPATENADIFAIQAMFNGKANEGQQKRGMDYILRKLCETEKMTFWPGDDGRRASDFAEGKRWVGLQLRRIERLRPDMTAMGLPPSHEQAPENP